MDRWTDLAPMAERAGQFHYATDGRDVLFNEPDGWEVEQPGLWWSDGGDGGGPRWPMTWGNPIPGAVGAVFEGLAAIPAVTRCTEIICDTIAGLPWPVRRGWERLGDPDWLTDPQALRLDARVADPDRVPEVRLSNVEFWANWICAALWFGDGFVYAPVRQDDGQPRPPLWQLHPLTVDIDNDRYFVDDIELEPGSVIHLRGNPPYEDGRGRGVLTTHGADLGLAATVRRFAWSAFHSGVPAGYLKVHAAGLTNKQANDLKSAWMAAHGRGRRSIAVLNATTDFTPISVSPVDVQLDRHREWGLRDVALAFGVPAWFLGIPGDSSTYANVESRMTELYSLTLKPWIRRIESTLDAQLVRGTELKINFDGLLRADTKTRMETYKTAIDIGVRTVDEVRALEDLPPLDVATMADEDPALPPVPVEEGPPYVGL